MVTMIYFLLAGVLAVVIASIRIKPVYAHCDTLDGPVVNAARKALSERNPNHVLIWVRPEDEEAIIDLFNVTVETIETAQSDEVVNAAELAFFDDVVRVHREGEGESHDGLKPAGTTSEEIQIADRAVRSGDLSEVEQHVHDAQHIKHLREMLCNLQDKAHYGIADIPAGREYVHAYAHFIHAVEHVIKGGDSHHSH